MRQSLRRAARQMTAIVSSSAFFLLSVAPFARATPVRFAWDPNAEADLAGYRLHWGDEPRAYTTTVDSPGTGTTITVDMPPGFHFVAATAYDTHGNESDYSSPELRAFCDDTKCRNADDPTNPVVPLVRAEFYADEAGQAHIIGLNASNERVLSQTYPAVPGFSPSGIDQTMPLDGMLRLTYVSNDASQILRRKMDRYGLVDPGGDKIIGPFHDASWVPGDPPDWVVIGSGYDRDQTGLATVAFRAVVNGKIRFIDLDQNDEPVGGGTYFYTPSPEDGGFMPVMFQRSNDGSKRVYSASSDRRSLRILRWANGNVFLGAVRHDATMHFIGAARNQDGSGSHLLWGEGDNLNGFSVEIWNLDYMTDARIGGAVRYGPYAGSQPARVLRGLGEAWNIVWYYAADRRNSLWTLNALGQRMSYAQWDSGQSGWAMTFNPAFRIETFSDGTGQTVVVGGGPTGFPVNIVTLRAVPGFYPIRTVAERNPDGTFRQVFKSADGKQGFVQKLNADAYPMGEGVYIGPINAPGNWQFVGYDRNDNGEAAAAFRDTDAASATFGKIVVMGLDVSDRPLPGDVLEILPEPEDLALQARFFQYRNDGSGRLVLADGSGKILRFKRWDGTQSILATVPYTVGRPIVDYKCKPDGTSAHALFQIGDSTNGYKITLWNLDPDTDVKTGFYDYGPYAAAPGNVAKAIGLNRMAGGNREIVWQYVGVNTDYRYSHWILNGDGVMKGAPVRVDLPQTDWIPVLAQNATWPGTSAYASLDLFRILSEAYTAFNPGSVSGIHAPQVPNDKSMGYPHQKPLMAGLETLA